MAKHRLKKMQWKNWACLTKAVMKCNKLHLTLRTSEGHNTPGSVSTLKASVNSSVIREPSSTWILQLQELSAG